jgi:predicted transcriptional regulator
MMEMTTQEVEFAAEGTLLEVLRVVDVKDSIASVQLRVREWIDERHYRDVDVSGDPVPAFVPEWLAA